MTLKAIRRRMLELDHTLGQTYVIDAAGVGDRSITITQLANSSYSKGWGEDRQLIRSDSTAVADRVRLAADFDPISGILYTDPNSTAYSDKTVSAQGDEYVEVLAKGVNVFDLDIAIQRALRTTRFIDRRTVPMNMSGRYWLDALTWVDGPGDIYRVYRTTNPVLTNNRHFEKWWGWSSGAIVPDDWTLGSNATFSRESTNVQRGQYGLDIVTTGVTTVEQTYRVMQSGVSSDSLRGETVTGVAMARSGTASSQRVRVTSEDAAGNVLSTTNSSYHDGDDDWQELTAEHTVDDAAEILRVSFRQEQNETAELDELYLMVGAINDGVRRDSYIETPIDVDFEQGQPLLMHGPAGKSQSLTVASYRPFPEFTASRVAIGSADGDTHDAPVELIARRALARYYEYLTDPTPVQVAAGFDHMRKAERLAVNYLGVEDEGRTGFPIPPLGVAGGGRF